MDQLQKILLLIVSLTSMQQDTLIVFGAFVVVYKALEVVGKTSSARR